MLCFSLYLSQELSSQLVTLSLTLSYSSPPASAALAVLTISTLPFLLSLSLFVLFNHSLLKYFRCSYQKQIDLSPFE